METSLPESTLRQLADAVQPAAIYQLGHSTSTQEYKNIFSRKAVTTSHTNTFLLLVLVNANEPSLYAVQDKAEALSTALYSITCWTMTAQQFNSLLFDADRFALQVNNYGKLLYNKEGFKPEQPNSKQSEAVKENHAVWLTRANSFLAGAELYILRRDTRLAAFMLHQAAEQAFTALILQATGYYPNTHNIAKLYRYATPFHEALAGLFREERWNCENILVVLQKAYTESRYAENYTLKTGLLETLFEKLTGLCTIVNKCFKEAKWQKEPELLKSEILA